MDIPMVIKMDTQMETQMVIRMEIRAMETGNLLEIIKSGICSLVLRQMKICFVNKAMEFHTFLENDFKFSKQ